jgi:hypothetical protein
VRQSREDATVGAVVEDHAGDDDVDDGGDDVGDDAGGYSAGMDLVLVEIPQLGLDLLELGEQGSCILLDHLQSFHPNLEF